MGRSRIERGSIQAREVPLETSVVANVEVAGERDKNHGNAARYRHLDPVGDAVREKGAILQRLGELHRLLNS